MSCCKKYYQVCDPVPDCLSELLVKTPLSLADVVVRLIDKFNKSYNLPGTSDAEGVVTFEVSGENSIVPNALLNPYAGIFTIMFYDGTTQLTFTVDAVEYDALRFVVGSVFPKVDTYLLDYSNSAGEGGEFDLSFDQSFSI